MSHLIYLLEVEWLIFFWKEEAFIDSPLGKNM